MQAAITAPDRDAYFILKARTETRAFLVSIQKRPAGPRQPDGNPTLKAKN
jgi:hypothetical protein